MAAGLGCGHDHCTRLAVLCTCLQVANRGLCAVAQAESMRYKLLGGLAVRRACYGVLRFVMESGACPGFNLKAHACLHLRLACGVLLCIASLLLEHP